MSSMVSIIIPAHNAEATIAETLTSATSQNYPDFEIIVVDDGSTDATAGIVAGFAAHTPRLRLITQANGGVARARNRGIAEARGAYIAPLDADDIWHCDKIGRQVAMMEQSGPDVALVYNWFRRIDSDGLVIPGSPHPRIEGWALHRHLAWNFISNGSTPLLRASSLQILGYDPALRDAGNQGCEDYLLQLQMAQHHKLACVPAYLTGYRRMPGAMSSDVARMLRSHLQVFGIIEKTAHPSAQTVVRHEMARLHVELSRNRLRKGQWREAASHVVQALRCDPSNSAAAAWHEIRHLVSSSGAGMAQAPLRHFRSYEPEESDGRWVTKRTQHSLSRLERLDQAYGAAQEKTSKA